MKQVLTKKNPIFLAKFGLFRHFSAKSRIFKRDFEGVRVEIDPQKMKPQNRFLTCRIHFRGQNFEIPKIDFSKKVDGGVLNWLFLIIVVSWIFKYFRNFKKVQRISGNQQLVSLFPDDYEDYQDNRAMGRDNLLARTSYTYLQQDLNLSTDHFRKIVFTDFSECIVINEDEAVITQNTIIEV